MTRKQIIKHIIKNKELLEIISSGCTIECITLGGSLALGLETASSDIDLVIWVSEQDYLMLQTNKKLLSCPTVYFEFEGITIHWYYSNTKYLNTKHWKYLYDLSAIEHCFAMKNHSLLILENIPNSYKKVEAAQQQLFLETLQICKLQYLTTINILLNYADFGPGITKHVYHLVIVSCLLNNEELDVAKINQLKSYAKNNSTTVTLDQQFEYDKDTLQYCREHLLKLKNVFETLK